MFNYKTLFSTVFPVAIGIVGAFIVLGYFSPRFQNGSNSVTSAQPSPTRDPVYRLGGFEDFIKKYPNDWDQRIDPVIKPMVIFQRMIGERATIISYSDQAESPSNPNPKFRVFIKEWDGTDLFSIGVPRTYRGKPVEFVPVEHETIPASQ